MFFLCDGEEEGEADDDVEHLDGRVEASYRFKNIPLRRIDHSHGIQKVLRQCRASKFGKR